MKKIPTLYQRDVDDLSHVTRQVHNDCVWVIQGEGVATVKWDGTCILIEPWFAPRSLDGVFSRRVVKPGKAAPDGFISVEHDPVTGKTVGWEPAAQSGFAKWITQAINARDFYLGTYELIGPKVNGNPHEMTNHEMIRHGVHTLDGFPRTFDEIPAALDALDWPVNPEGVVFYHPDGRMAKIKRKDFPA